MPHDPLGFLLQRIGLFGLTALDLLVVSSSFLLVLLKLLLQVCDEMLGIGVHRAQSAAGKTRCSPP